MEAIPLLPESIEVFRIWSDLSFCFCWFSFIEMIAPLSVQSKLSCWVILLFTYILFYFFDPCIFFNTKVTFSFLFFILILFVLWKLLFFSHLEIPYFPNEHLTLSREHMLLCLFTFLVEPALLFRSNLCFLCWFAFGLGTLGK